MSTKKTPIEPSAAERIDERIANLLGWRGDTLSRSRESIRTAEPGMVEERRWRGTPARECDGIDGIGEWDRNVIKPTFVRGANIPDPRGLFKSSHEGNTRRAIDFHTADTIPAAVLRQLVRAAVSLNRKTRKRDQP